MFCNQFSTLCKEGIIYTRWPNAYILRSSLQYDSIQGLYLNLFYVTAELYDYKLMVQWKTVVALYKIRRQLGVSVQPSKCGYTYSKHLVVIYHFLMSFMYNVVHRIVWIQYAIHIHKTE